MADPAPYTVEAHTAGDGYRWRFRRYPAAGPPRAHVVCVHGIQSHAGWYEHSCTQLARAGFAVDFIDRRGSGMNEADRGDAPGFRRLLDDVAEFLKPGQRITQRRGIALSPADQQSRELPLHEGVGPLPARRRPDTGS